MHGEHRETGLTEHGFNNASAMTRCKQILVCRIQDHMCDLDNISLPGAK